MRVRVRVPGPGAYDERNQQGSLVSAIEKKTHARNGVFGSSEPNRFFGSALHVRTSKDGFRAPWLADS